MAKDYGPKVTITEEILDDDKGTDLNLGDAFQEQEYSRRWAVIKRGERGSDEMCKRGCGYFEK